MKYFYFLIILFSSSYLHAQDSDSPETPRSSLKIGAGFMNNGVYLGRSDSMAIPSFNTGLTYTLRSGIFFSGTLNFIPSREFNKLDGESLETGYNFEHKNLSGGIAISKIFSSQNSTEVLSAINASIGAELTYNLYDIVSPSINVNFALGKPGAGSDFMFNWGLTHEFSVAKLFDSQDRLALSPSLHLNAGTQNFYSSYFVRKRISEKIRQTHRKSKVKTTTVKAKSAVSVNSTKTVITEVIKNHSKFQILDYEFALPMSYTFKRFSFELNPVYAVAVHKFADDGTKTYNVPNSSVFYFEGGVSFKF